MNSFTNNRGYSLVEVMVSLGLLGIALLGMAYMQGQQQRSQGSVEHQMRLRQTMQEIVTRIASRATEFPVINNLGGTLPMTYVACFRDDGQAVTRIWPVAGEEGFVGAFLPGVTVHTLAYEGGGNGGVQICRLNEGGLEVHVYRESINVIDEYSVSVISLPGVGIYARPFPVITTSIRALIRI